MPFIARYRKEKTGGLDDTQLRKLEERLGYLTELEDRRATVLKSITGRCHVKQILLHKRSYSLCSTFMFFKAFSHSDEHQNRPNFV